MIHQAVPSRKIVQPVFGTSCGLLSAEYAKNIELARQTRCYKNSCVLMSSSANLLLELFFECVVVIAKTTVQLRP